MNKNEKIKYLLMSKPVDELKTLARNAGLKGYSKLKKEDLIALIIKEDVFSKPIQKPIEKEDKQSKFDSFWKKYVDGRLRVFIAIVAGSIAIFAAFNGSFEKLRNWATPVFTEKDESLKILVLPLNPDSNCLIQKTNYENVIVDFYNTIKANFNHKIEAKATSEYSCPENIEEVKKIGISENADIVIWGNVEEMCEGKKSVRIKYYLVNDMQFLPNRTGGDSKMNTLSDLSDLRSGYLLKNVNKIVYRTLAIYFVNNSDYNNALEAVNKHGTDNCDLEILGIKSIAEFELGDNEKFGNATIKAISCLLNMKKSQKERLANLEKQKEQNSCERLNELTHTLLKDLLNEKAFYFYIEKNKAFSDAIKEHTNKPEFKQNRAMNELLLFTIKEVRKSFFKDDF